jgi:hypothetical protein
MRAIGYNARMKIILLIITLSIFLISCDNPVYYNNHQWDYPPTPAPLSMGAVILQINNDGTFVQDFYGTFSNIGTGEQIFFYSNHPITSITISDPTVLSLVGQKAQVLQSGKTATITFVSYGTTKTYNITTINDKRLVGARWHYPGSLSSLDFDNANVTQYLWDTINNNGVSKTDFIGQHTSSVKTYQTMITAGVFQINYNGTITNYDMNVQMWDIFTLVH